MCASSVLVISSRSVEETKDQTHGGRNWDRTEMEQEVTVGGGVVEGTGEHCDVLVHHKHRQQSIVLLVMAMTHASQR